MRLVAVVAACLLLAALPASSTVSATAAWPETTPIVDPPLRPWMRPLAEAPAPVLDALPWGALARNTDPIAFGMSFQEAGERRIREFEIAAAWADNRDGGHNHAFHTYGHPDYNRQVARVPVSFDSDAGVPLYGEIVLPERGAAPPIDDHYPVIVALEGLQGNLGMYRWWHQVFADAGYLVFAFDYTGQGHSGGSDEDTDAVRIDDAKRALDYLLHESPVAESIDDSRIGVVGHSMGAFTALDWQERDDRIQALVAGAPIHESQVSFETADIPIMVQTGDHDGPIAPVPFANPWFAKTVYDQLEGNRAFIVAEAASHCQHTNYPLCPTTTHGRPLAGQTSLDWMDWHLRGDTGAKGRLTQPPDGLSYLWSSEVVLDGQTTVVAQGLLG